MTETGWPLIPREVLPAPVPAAPRRRHPRPALPGGGDAGRQLPFFGAETTEPSPADLAGLLAGPGRLGRMGGTARVSVPVDAAWRVHVLVEELVLRGLVTSWRPLAAAGDGPTAKEAEEPAEAGGNGSAGTTDASTTGDGTTGAGTTGDGAKGDAKERDGAEGDGGKGDGGKGDGAAGHAAPRFEVLTAYSRRLNGLAQAWPQAAAQLFLSGPRLRLWVAAAGEPVPGGYALGLDPAKDPAVIDAALVRAGLAGRVSDHGRTYRIMGRRRVARLAELVGNRPAAAHAEWWPGGAGA